MKKAHWIAAPDGAVETCPLFCRRVNLREGIRRAKLYATAMGLYRFFIGGKSVTDNVFMPGYTSYRHRVQMQEYDVTHLCRAGEIELTALLGNGWAAATLFGCRERPYAPRPALYAYLEISYEGGAKEIFGTDESWDVYTSHILSSDLYAGEEQDCTRPSEFRCRTVRADVPAKIVPQEGENVVEAGTVLPRRIFVTPAGEKVVDFGQNLTGYVRVRGRAKRGEKISFVPAEILDKNGNFYNENYRSAVSRCRYTFSGGEDDFRPVFSFQGFRYIRLDEFPEGAEVTFTAVVVHSDLRRTGRFLCGNEKINQLDRNIVWGQLGNYLDVPTDCPQRDERLGWTGDAEVFCRTAAINFDVNRFFRKWLHDMIIDQMPDGGIQGVIPVIPDFFLFCAAGWGDAITICPWEIYMAYADRKLLAECFPAMCRWLEYIRGAGDDPYLWNTGEQYGDWLATDAPYGSYVGATNIGLICTAFYAHSAELVVRAGRVLGEDVSAYEALHGKIVARFRETFMKDGLPVGEPALCGTAKEQTCYTQTALALILRFGLAEEGERAKLTEALVSLIEKNGMRMTTGFLGTPHILHALSENGRADIAYRLLLQEKAPSWLYSVNRGATTIWEHWDGINEQGEVWSKDMNSFNHYAYGAVFDWIYGVCVGIVPVEPGYRRVNICPHPSRELGFTAMEYETPFGTLRAGWHYEGEEVFYEYEIPAGVAADICLPDGRTFSFAGESPVQLRC